jgi:cyanophycin synthetase
VFQSTLTEFTPAIGVGLARSKFEAAHILRLHGIPVTSHHLVGTEADAVAAANTLGYPVVIKPEDSDGGRGVYCGLVHESQVKQYFSKARQISNRILVEKHVEGLDFRITIAHGKMVKAIGRIPGGVLGDGIHSIAALLQERSRKADSRAALPMDEEALQLMREKGYDPESVLRADEFLPLRRRANMSSGGTSYDVREQIHSDNVALAVRAAEALCLDIAGIDFLTPDIAKSWIHSGAVICEVNAQPQISKEFAPNVYHDLLQQAVQAPVRLRTALLLLTDPSVDPEDHITEAVTALMGQGEQVLSVRSSGLWLDHTQIGQADSNIFSMAEGAELNRHATAVVAALPVQTIQERGLPWLFIDHACLLMDAHDSAKLEQQLGQLHALMAPHTLRPWSVKNQHSFGHSENLSNEWLAAAAPDGSGVPSTGWLSCT